MPGQKLIPVAGIIEIAPLGAILARSDNSAVSIKSLYFDFAAGTLMQGPEGSRTAVNVAATTTAPIIAATPLTWLNMYGTGYSPSQDETTADAPVEWGDADNKYGDDSEVTKIVHTFSFEGLYKSSELFWKSLRTTKDAFGNERLYYARFFPEGKKGGAEVWHGAVENRGLSVDFAREDYATMSVDFPYKSRGYITDLPAVYPA